MREMRSELHMRRLLILALAALILLTAVSGVATAGSGDENYHGEAGEQPANGADDSPGSGEPNQDQAADTGDRTRNKDR